MHSLFRQFSINFKLIQLVDDGVQFFLIADILYAIILLFYSENSVEFSNYNCFSNFTFSSIWFCFMYFEALLLGVCNLETYLLGELPVLSLCNSLFMVIFLVLRSGISVVQFM